MDLGASNMLINIKVEASKSEVHLNYPVDIKRRKRLGSSQEIKFQCPEETKRRVKKKINQVDRIYEIVIVKAVNSKSR